MSSFQSDIVRFEELGAQVLGVSGDSLDTHFELAAKLGLSFPLIADDGTIRQAYGSGRITYLVDEGQIIRLVVKGMPDNDELVEELGKMR